MADDRIYSVNLGSRHVSGAVFKPTPDGGLILEKYERSDLVGDPTEDDRRNAQTRMALKQVSSSLKAKGQTVPYVTSSFPVFTRFVNLPQLDGEQVEEIVKFEAQQQVPYDINDVVWDYQLIGDEDDIEVEVLLAAVKKDELNEIDELVEGAGFTSGGVEIAPLALYNAFRFNYPELDQTTVVIDIGARTTNLIFAEGKKVFVRTIKIGGADISKAIAKEFSVSYEEADVRKAVDGFVALGGPYADHEDPVIAGISKVIRNSLTRLHSEVMRTTNFYRSQQGGSAPKLALLNGATAALPFIREFFAEKLNLPIDYFNALRNVRIGSGVDRDHVASHAHNLGELVGSAVRQSGPTPMSVVLVPDSVKAVQDLKKRKPALVMAMVSLAALLAGLGFFFTQGQTIAAENASEIEGEANALDDHAKSIDKIEDELKVVSLKKEPFRNVVIHRVYWTQVFDYLSYMMQSDFMFITSFEPTSGGVVLVNPEIPGLPTGGGEEKIIDGFRIEGLWRENRPKGAKVVYEYFDVLKKDAIDNPDTAFFDLKDVDAQTAIEQVDAGNGTKYAYRWIMSLPVPKQYQVKYTN